jgi:hypothetical protein
MRRAFLLVLAGAAACNGGALSPPISNNQFDDPCDPGSSSGATGTLPPVDAGATPVSLPGGAAGIGFDDLGFSPTLAQILVPAGRTGMLDLVDPSSEAVTQVGGFSAQGTYGGDDTFGVTSAVEGNGTVYAMDRTAKTLAVVDARKKAIVGSTTLAATPGYVRYVGTTNELWVTEPGAHQIEVFAPASDASAGPTQSAVIAVADGPESLVVDDGAKRAYTHTTTATVAIDVAGRAIAAEWPNGCSTSRGIAVDTSHGWVLSACEEGKLVVLDAQSGATIGSVTVGAGVDQIAYDALRMRAYVPGPAAAAMSVVKLGSNGVPTALGSVETPNDSHCAVTPGGGSVFVCAPSQGALLFVRDPF